MARRIVSLFAAALIVAGIVAYFDIRQGPSAAEVLADAKAHVATHRSARFAGEISVTTATGGASGTAVNGELGRNGVTRAVLSSDAAGAAETVVVGDRAYVREAETVVRLAQAKFAPFDANQSSKSTRVLRPTDLDIRALLRAAQDPVVLRRSGSLTTIAAAVNSDTMELTVHRGGRVQSVVLRTRSDAQTVTTTLRYRDWNVDVDVQEPSAAELDPTPRIDEAAIAAWNATSPLMPKTLPRGWKLVYADVLGAAQTAEGCAQLELRYESPGADEGYLYLYQFPLSCARSLSGPDVRSFRAGTYEGFGLMSADGVALAQITVRSTAVQADSTLSLAELVTILDEFVPLKLAG